MKIIDQELINIFHKNNNDLLNLLKYDLKKIEKEINTKFNGKHKFSISTSFIYDRESKKKLSVFDFKRKLLSIVTCDLKGVDIYFNSINPINEKGDYIYVDSFILVNGLIFVSLNDEYDSKENQYMKEFKEAIISKFNII